MPAQGTTPDSLNLVVRRIIPAPASLLFDAWTSAEALRRWWGPAGVSCPRAEVDLRVGGRYRIANQMPGGRVLWISGEFEIIDRPHRLAYTWQIGEDRTGDERVTVHFRPVDPRTTEVIVTHERIASPAAKAEHESGWEGCLDGLVRHVGASVK